MEIDSEQDTEGREDDTRGDVGDDRDQDRLRQARPSVPWIPMIDVMIVIRTKRASNPPITGMIATNANTSGAWTEPMVRDRDSALTVW